jgi:SAM-dependent methyltransferase
MEPRSSEAELARRWDAAYSRRGADGVSWYQQEPRVSLELVDALGLAPSAAVVDVGGGTSAFADRLVARGFRDLTVLDVSPRALVHARRRVGRDAPIDWLQQDLLSWRPERRFDLWHDRAVFHFLVTRADRDRYLETLQAALRADGALVLATFAADGPESCSGLPVARYSAAGLARLLGSDFALVEVRREEHVTPGGAVQPFTWIAGRMRAA